MAAHADALAEVDGIGALTARKLRWCVEEPPAVFAVKEEHRR
jgi:hypothetical protein